MLALEKKTEIDALTARFTSPENANGSLMMNDAYQRRLTAIHTRPDPAPQPAPALQRGGVTHKFLLKLFEQFIPMVRDYVEGRVEPLQKRITELEARPTMRYCGVWESQRQYNEGDIVSDHGSMWFCKRSTRGRPGSSEDFQLCVKRGKDGRP